MYNLYLEKSIRKESKELAWYEYIPNMLKL